MIYRNKKANDWYVFVFTANNFTGELIDSPEGKLEWIPDEKLPSLNLWASDLVFFPWLEKEKFFSTKFIYQGDEMKSYEVSFHP